MWTDVTTFRGRRFLAPTFEPVIVTDGEGRITRLNRAAESLFGARANAFGKHIAEVTHDQRIAMAVSEALRAERTVAAESAEYCIPLDTARVAKPVFPNGIIYLMLADSLGDFLVNQDFAELFPEK
jgi:PAS domain-containing protein